MPAIINGDLVRRVVSDPNTAAHLVSLVARKGKAKKGAGKIIGIVIAIVVIIIIIAIIFLVWKKMQAKKRLQQGGH
ncbi:uncharacterized protein BDR25DRAFT_299530 [Lindgomyces ingoldianus]|uniref:Uncharacterized protein n=1 Tax=Lindgomyces ingoldianus TaxID=673940 RepID=A0ACB6RF74_9PLEO|nr:uncharacterized protein BDR25DRAFT_299530 [Lindgomyces ingoldianus]KAF2477705.1 hypothetical protein BDR25DRAFT_299530 [Lindgomyces ingoldianus]